MRSTRLTAVWLAFGTVVLGAACDRREDADEAAPTTQELEQPATPSGEPLASGDFDEAKGVTGDVGGHFELRPTAAGGASLMAQIEGLTPGEHAWHIHEGDCGTDGPVAVALTGAPGAQSWTAGADGRATANATISQTDLQKLQATTAVADSTPATKVSPPNSENAPVDRPVPGVAGDSDRKLSIHVHERGGADHGPTVACANLDAAKLRTTTGEAPRY